MALEKGRKILKMELEIVEGPKREDIMFVLWSAARGEMPSAATTPRFALIRKGAPGNRTSSIGVSISGIQLPDYQVTGNPVISGRVVNKDWDFDEVCDPGVSLRNTFEASYDPRTRKGTMRIFAQEETKSETMYILVLSSDLNFCHPAIQLMGSGAKMRVIIVRENGSLEEAFRGERFSQEGYKEKRGEERDLTRVTLKTKAILAGYRKLSDEI